MTIPRRRMPGSNEQWHREAAILAKALPYMRKYAETVFVVKLGGAAMGDAELAGLTAADMVLLTQVGIKLVVVHGGGPKISEKLKTRRIKSNFHRGLRVTDAETLLVVEETLKEINGEIVTQIKKHGGRAIGMCGKNADIMTAEKLTHKWPASDPSSQEAPDLGLVGEPKKVNGDLLAGFYNQGATPVVAPIGSGKNGEFYNVNADVAAGAIATELKARRLIMMTDVKGITDRAGELLTSIDLKQGKELLENGAVQGGMRPKLETCLKAVKSGVRGVVIVDGRVRHALLLEIFTQHGVGTLITP